MAVSHFLVRRLMGVLSGIQQYAGSAGVFLLLSSYTYSGSDFPTNRSSISCAEWARKLYTDLQSCYTLKWINPCTWILVYFIHFVWMKKWTFSVCKCNAQSSMQNEKRVVCINSDVVHRDMFKTNTIDIVSEGKMWLTLATAAVSQWSQTAIYFYHSRDVSVVEEEHVELLYVGN